MGKFVYVRENKTKPNQPGWWSDKKRLEAVTTWLALGNLRMVAAQINVPHDTLRRWRYEDWWKETEQAIRSEEAQQLDGKLSKALDKALDAVMDRIEQGEYIYDQKTGKVKRMPVKLRDVNHAFNSLIDKRQLIRNLPTTIKGESADTNAKLQQLANQFAAFTNQKVKEKVVNEYIEGETVVQQDDGTYEVT